MRSATLPSPDGNLVVRIRHSHYSIDLVQYPHRIAVYHFSRPRRRPVWAIGGAFSVVWVRRSPASALRSCFSLNATSFETFLRIVSACSGVIAGCGRHVCLCASWVAHPEARFHVATAALIDARRVYYHSWVMMTPVNAPQIHFLPKCAASSATIASCFARHETHGAPIATQLTQNGGNCLHAHWRVGLDEEVRRHALSGDFAGVT